MERRQFTREFKLEAVRLTKKRGVSDAQASKDLGVHSPRSVGFLFSIATPTSSYQAHLRNSSDAHV
jgi:hypothetical protein